MDAEADDTRDLETGSPLFIREMAVDDDWYLLRNPAIFKQLTRDGIGNLHRHFRLHGDGVGADPNPWFLLSHYILTSGFEQRAPGHTPCEDYIRYAGAARWSAHWLFDEVRYQQLYPSVRDAVQKRNLVSGYMHFLRYRRRQEFLPPPLFNAAYYQQVAQLPDNTDPYTHFLKVGQFQGHSPHPMFNSEHYLQTNPIPEAVGNDKPFTSALHHFIVHGMQRGASPCPDFDAEFYVRCYPDVAEAVQQKLFNSPFQHFLECGQQEGRQPNEYFSASDYLWYNPDIEREIAAAKLHSPFEHFLAFGISRGLRAHRPAYAVIAPDLHAKAIFEQRVRIASQLFIHEGLNLPASEQPAVTFILPVHDNFMFTVALLGQFEREAKAVPSIPIEFIVVDDGSSDQTCEIEAQVTGLRVVHLAERTGYTGACNRGAAVARGEILVFLNNDIELTPGLLPRVVRSLSDPTVGVSGARIVNAAGRLQEAGSVLWRDASGAGFGRGHDPVQPLYLVARDVDYVSGCFLCVRRRLFEEIGGFDERFSPGYYEDTDFCLQVRARNLRVVYDPTLVIYHYEYASYSKGRPPGVSSAIMVRNQRAFVAKNRDLLARQPTHGDHSVARAAFPPDRSSQRRVLLIEDRVPAHVVGSGFTRSADIVTAMTDAGAAVSIWSLHQRTIFDVPPWSNGAWSLLPQITGPQTVGELLRLHGDEFDVVWVCRSHNYRLLRLELLQWRDARAHRRLVVDTEAIDALRTASMLERAGRTLSEEDVLAAIRTEMPEVGAADVVVAINERDAGAVMRAFGITAAVIGHRFQVRPAETDFAARTGLLFVGAFYGSDTPNYDALRWFITEVFPKVVSRIPDIDFTVIGHQHRTVAPIESPFASQIHWLGEVTDLTSAFASARVFVAPTRYAGGLPHKVENAVAHGLPAVVTPLLAEQLHCGGAEEFALSPTGWSADEFGECVVRLYCDQELWRQRRDRGLRHVSTRCGAQDFDTAVVGITRG